MERVLRVNHLIRKEISQIILKEIDFPEDAFITVTRVETSRGLLQTKVYISVLPINKTTQVLEILNRQIFFIQHKLNKRLKMRPIPKLQFIEEKATREAGRIEELLEQIHQKNV